MNKTIKRISYLFCAAIVVVCSQPVIADSHGLELGVLKCTVVPGSRLNLIIRSTADVVCEFNNAGTVEKYKGETGIGLGLDLSFKTDERMHFAVFAVSSDVSAGSHALAGKYVGGELNAAAGVGLGAKALVGGSNDSFSLQPLALETSTGIGASGGLSFLYIEADK